MNENGKELWSIKVYVSLLLLYLQPIPLQYSDSRSALRTRGWFSFLHHDWSTVYPIWKFIHSLDRRPCTFASKQKLVLSTKMGMNYDRAKFMFLSSSYICSPFPCSILTLAARSEPEGGSVSCIIIDETFLQSGSFYFRWIEHPLCLLHTKI